MIDRFAGPSEFTAFLDVLRARCEVWEMEGGRDYRRMESGRETMRAVERDVGVEGVDVEEWRVDGHEDLQHGVGMAGWPADRAGKMEEGAEEEAKVSSPRYYAVTAPEDGDIPMSYEEVLNQTTGTPNPTFTPTTMRVYGRSIPVPRAHAGVTSWTFTELCKSTLGPADYSTLASTFHTLILTDVPILTWLMKNEARRFITLLDALYECRCKLYISAAAGPDGIFFPDEQKKQNHDSDDAVYAETFSEAYQDATAPFRPNVLSQNPNYVELPPEPDYTHARLAGLLNADAIEDDPPNKPHASNGFARSFGRTDSEMERAPVDPDESPYTSPTSSSAARGRRSPDFGKASAFTGEDERFAYRRAQSRLWEMCGAKWWARSEEGWHRPLPVEVRRWERSAAEWGADSLGVPPVVDGKRVGGGIAGGGSDVAIGGAVEDGTRDERSFKKRAEPGEGEESVASPFRVTAEPPPKLDPWHIWSLGKWGKRAGAWGKGTEGLKERERQREREGKEKG